MITVSEIISNAKAFGACGLANHKIQSWEALAELYFSPQGIEFCNNMNFPSMALWHKIRTGHDVSEFGIFIEGRIRHSVNRPNVAIIGTHARLVYNQIGKYTIVLQHGARAIIQASNYAVLNIVKIGTCEVKLETDNTVRVL